MSAWSQNRVQHKQPVIQGVERVIQGNLYRAFGPPGGGLFVSKKSPSDYSFKRKSMDQILKKEDKLEYKGGIFNSKKGSLILTSAELYFETKKAKRIFSIPLKSIQSVNCKKGIGNGVDHLFVIYSENGSEKKVKIQHYSFISGEALGRFSRLSTYFSSWEQSINDARFGRNGNPSSNLDGLEKLAELRQKGVITEEEFSAKKKQLLGI
jgi:hypothetical protein